MQVLDSHRPWTRILSSQKVRQKSLSLGIVARRTDSGIGYKEYKTERTYMAKMGDWRENKDVEIPLDGIGGVNILVKADVHRSGQSYPSLRHSEFSS